MFRIVGDVRRKGEMMVTLCFVLYAAFLLALPLLWWRLGERHWLLILLRYAPPILYLIPTFALLGAAALLRMKRTALATVLLWLVIVLGPMDFQLPARGTRREDSHFRYSPTTYGPGWGGKEKIAEYLAATDADLIGLQESREPVDQRYVDPTETIKAAMKGYSSARGGIRGELLSLSRWPILSTREHDLKGYSPCLEIVVDADGQKLRFLNVHVMTGDPKGVLKRGAHARTDFLVVTARSRHDQTHALLEVLAASDLPTVLVGDFNSPPGSRLYNSLAGAMQDSFARKGLGFGMTYRANRPLWRIDYVWASPALGVESCRVLSSDLSDHKPLAATLQR